MYVRRCSYDSHDTHAQCHSSGQRPAAIVSPLAGTTRDVLESALDIFGYPIVIRCLYISTHDNLLVIIIIMQYVYILYWI